MIKYLFKVETNWCGEDNTYAVILENEHDPIFTGMAEEAAYENFSSFDGITTILEELFPDNEGEYSDEEYDEAYSVEHEYYSWSLALFEGDEEDWQDYELFYDYKDNS